ncbi:hypothetical protein GCM10027435_29180 [Haloparvum alkalitolerans]|uniref:NADPH-dependent FMN reductase n=1 Tax=Haloparvum alkalitolerans TaxID=1042953 RepID=UPI003CEF4C84
MSDGTAPSADRTVLGVVGSVTTGSKTRAAVEAALDAAADEREGVETDLLHLAEYDLETADGRGIDAYEGDTADALARIVEADAYVVGTPVYRGSVSGALKNLLDMVPRGMWQGDVAPFEDAAVGLVATGATNHHYLAIDQELRPLFAFFGAHTVGGSVYATDGAFADREGADGDDEGPVLDDADVAGRLATLGTATVDLSRAVEGSDALGGLGPQF